MLRADITENRSCQVLVSQGEIYRFLWVLIMSKYDRFLTVGVPGSYLEKYSSSTIFRDSPGVYYKYRSLP
jgi:hypothetical protein